MISLPSVTDPERRLSLAYAPAAARASLATLWALDERFATVLASTTESGIGAIRLAWWREALQRLDAGVVPPEPLLQAIGQHLVPAGVSGQLLSGLEDGWLPLLGELDARGLSDHGRERGGRLFRIAASLLGVEASEDLVREGEAWALTDLAFHLSDRAAAERALVLARARWDAAPPYRWPRPLRSIGILASLGRADAVSGFDQPRTQGSPGRVLRALWHGLTGR
ncbi:hypothetical protein [Flavisphingomonas formosensis]|uniref:hypothetical protein n=1 Tax=Flavisphingomonas formosensis TaxID=861534 RepID=UPI0012F99910|nr:hypothetical protein [Sphingomonas formosensis]